MKKILLGGLITLLLLVSINSYSQFLRDDNLVFELGHEQIDIGQSYIKTDSLLRKMRFRLDSVGVIQIKERIFKFKLYTGDLNGEKANIMIVLSKYDLVWKLVVDVFSKDPIYSYDLYKYTLSKEYGKSNIINDCISSGKIWSLWQSKDRLVNGDSVNAISLCLEETSSESAVISIVYQHSVYLSIDE
jgi:hypothetical protein